MSVSIINHRARDLLRSCLRSLELYPYTLGSMEVVVLDNASHDGSVEMLREEFPDVIVLAENTRRGFGANQNRAVSMCRGELVLILNPDAVVGAETIDALVQAMWRDDRVAAVGCRVLNRDGTTRQEEPFPFPTPTSIYWKAVGLGRVFRSRKASEDVFGDRWLGAGAMLIDRKAFSEVGGFDESFFMYSEDVDLCRRLRAAGYLFAWVRHASVIHPLPEESREMRQRRQREIVKAELSYVLKYYGPLGKFAYRLGVALDSGFRVLALALPRISRAVRVHGASKADARALHLARLRAAVWPTGGGLGELATVWNSRRP